MENFENEEYFDSKQKNIEKLCDKQVYKNYTGDEYDEIDLDGEHLENAFTNKKHYLSMKLLPLQEKKVLYYSVTENYSLNRIAKLMNISKSEVVRLKEKAISDFKANLRRISKGDNK